MKRNNVDNNVEKMKADSFVTLFHPPCRFIKGSFISFV